MYTVKAFKKALENGIFVLKPMNKTKCVDFQTAAEDYVGLEIADGVVNTIASLHSDGIKAKIKLLNGDIVKFKEIEDQTLNGSPIESLLLNVSNGQIFKIYNFYEFASNKDKDFYEVRERTIVAKTTFFERI